MKLLVVLFTLFTVSVFAQPNIAVIKKDSCYKKATARSKQRFAEWECGKIAGVVDCNEKLELDEASNTVITASAKKPFTGTCETCHMNGILERRITFVNGKTDGIDTTYYASGCIMVIRNHVQGAENGHWTYFYDSIAMPAWEMNYSVGLQHGEQITYNKKGDTTKYENYVNGVLNGPKLTFDKAGVRTKKANYVNGLLEGPFLVYNTEGKIIEELNYREGKKHGVFKYYYDDGTLLRTENWDMDSKNGEFKTFYYDQTLQSLETWKKYSGKPVDYITGTIYEFNDKETAYKVGGLMNQKKTPEQIKEELGEVEYTSTAIAGVIQDEHEILDGQKLERGLNLPFKSGDKYYVVDVTRKASVARTEIREGWFEERFPDQKLKRRALYKKDILIEEHVYDEQGREIRSFGGTATSGAEDDAVPTGETKKKKNKKQKEQAPPPAEEPKEEE